MPSKIDTKSFREAWASFILDLQTRICTAIEDIDGKEKFLSETWGREGGGGGLTRVIAGGAVFEREALILLW